ncbi:hypothetical protein DFR58_1256 [Anaerobacterium chartisolvens]|uniref:Tail sheath protein C-terminal domain-containing protein n=1 Tax=Anaerobacterium chartisolvens TaxID=1297424 RepID=A0A369APR6_9FIRM|nr:phage tail sheath subtilisin-like domain-containing protein [Anaerobacterium chartisolvens]RCX11360.1 hypothetical protein DFR58_1256 [Anaerobacterium chartisolvens]
MAEYLSPGVYIEEFDQGGRPIEGVSTSTAGFVGMAERGSIKGVPELVTSFADFKRKFGGYLSKTEYGDYSYLPICVEQFFINGGARCFIMRAAPADAKSASNAGSDGKPAGCISVAAKNPGVWGNKIRVIISDASKAKTQIIDIKEDALTGNRYIVKNAVGFNEGDVVSFSDGQQTIINRVKKVQDDFIQFENNFDIDVIDQKLLPSKTVSTCEINIVIKYEDIVETFENVSLNAVAANFLEKRLAKSELIEAAYIPAADATEIVKPFEQITDGTADSSTITLAGGTNGQIASADASVFIGVDNGPGTRSGIQAFLENSLVSIMAVPGVTDPNVQLTLVAHCENLGSRFAVLDIPRDKKKVDEVIAHRNIFDSNYAALYHPWIEVFDPLDKKSTFIPPSVSVAGIYARSDTSRGVQKAPANEVVRGATGLDCLYNKGEQDILNPQGVNLIRVFPGQGIRVWGARTCSSETNWKYVNVRRLFIFIEESIKANINWAVFEPNDVMLWARVKRSIEVFLINLWRNGALAGSTADEALFVDIGRTTMTQDDIDNGRLICVIGVAPVKPAEFVIFRITQKVNESQA